VTVIVILTATATVTRRVKRTVVALIMIVALTMMAEQ